MTRISKAAARKMWDNSEAFIIVPCKCSPCGFGSLYTATDMSSDQYEMTFDNFVNSFEFYNCNHETGKYAAFYKEGN